MSTIQYKGLCQVEVQDLLSSTCMRRRSGEKGDETVKLVESIEFNEIDRVQRDRSSLVTTEIAVMNVQ